METNIALFTLLAIASAQNHGQATSKSLDAYLRYTGVDKQIDVINNNAKNMVPEEVKFYLAPGIFIGKTIIDRKIVIQWTFK